MSDKLPPLTWITALAILASLVVGGLFGRLHEVIVLCIMLQLLDGLFAQRRLFLNHVWQGILVIVLAFDLVGYLLNGRVFLR